LGENFTQLQYMNIYGALADDHVALPSFPQYRFPTHHIAIVNHHKAQ